MPVSREEPYASVGELIRARRRAQGWNQRQLAEAVNVAREYASRWENDHATPGPEHAGNLARVLGGEASEYRGLSGEPRNLRELVMQLRDRVEQLERRLAEVARTRH